MERSYLALVAQIRDAVRKIAQEIPVFKETGNGAIRILAYPLCREADEWFGGSYYGGLSDFGNPENPDIVDYEHTFAITAGGSRVIEAFWSPDKQLVDCYAISAMKIAHCSRAQDLGAGLVSGINLNDPHLTEDNGYGPYEGASCVEVRVQHKETNFDMPFCGIYVCVSGANPKDDQECSKVGVKVIHDFFRKGSIAGFGSPFVFLTA